MALGHPPSTAKTSGHRANSKTTQTVGLPATRNGLAHNMPPDCIKTSCMKLHAKPTKPINTTNAFPVARQEPPPPRDIGHAQAGDQTWRSRAPTLVTILGSFSKY